jgi:hypothetical protein
MAVAGGCFHRKAAPREELQPRAPQHEERAHRHGVRVLHHLLQARGEDPALITSFSASDPYQHHGSAALGRYRAVRTRGAALAAPAYEKFVLLPSSGAGSFTRVSGDTR